MKTQSNEAELEEKIKQIIDEANKPVTLVSSITGLEIDDLPKASGEEGQPLSSVIDPKTKSKATVRPQVNFKSFAANPGTTAETKKLIEDTEDSNMFK